MDVSVCLQIGSSSLNFCWQGSCDSLHEMCMFQDDCTAFAVSCCHRQWFCSPCPCKWLFQSDVLSLQSERMMSSSSIRGISIGVGRMDNNMMRVQAANLNRKGFEKQFGRKLLGTKPPRQPSKDFSDQQPGLLSLACSPEISLCHFHLHSVARLCMCWVLI